ncbi:MAG TPA: M28 family peptidase [Vicinamibacterales bacterium]|nr:M28 family peptidase [Vicinamibacterales bacterium]
MILTLLALALHVQTATPPAPKFDAGRAWDHLRQMVAIGPRPSGSPAIEQTRKYIKDQMTAIGLPVTEQVWDDQTPIDKIHLVNLSVVIPGARREKIVFAGHYDTKLFREFRFVGASDGASSAAFLIELARVLKARKNQYTIELLFLDGEEARLKEWNGTDNTYGSRHYVDVAKRDASIQAIKAMILVDMIGDRDLDIRRDTNSTPWLTDIFWTTAKHLDLDDYFIADSTRIEDDHLPFLAAGVPSVDIIDLDYDAWHTAKDNLDAVSARSLQVVGDVVLAALPTIETHLNKQAQLALVRKTGLKRRAGSPRKEFTLRLASHKKHRKLSAIAHQLSN